jgi:diadenosine tetraphosphate (Ap4A) HIT family hydrolase
LLLRTYDDDRISVVGERCVFCEIVRGEGPKGIVAYQDGTVTVFASRDQRPTNLGHMLVVTNEHHRDLIELPPSLDNDVMACLRRISMAVQESFGASGTTIRQNNGPPGQDVFHVHFHVVPRHSSDEEHAVRYQVVDLATRIAQAQAVKRFLSGA